MPEDGTIGDVMSRVELLNEAGQRRWKRWKARIWPKNQDALVASCASRIRKADGPLFLETRAANSGTSARVSSQFPSLSCRCAGLAAEVVFIVLLARWCIS